MGTLIRRPVLVPGLKPTLRAYHAAHTTLLCSLASEKPAVPLPIQSERLSITIPPLNVKIPQLDDVFPFFHSVMQPDAMALDQTDVWSPLDSFHLMDGVEDAIMREYTRI